MSPTAPTRLFIAAVGGYAYGAITAAIPSPSDPAAFWVANLAAPYMLLPFLAGAWQVRTRHAVIAGAVTAGGAIAGFYGFHLVGDVTNDQLDLPTTVTARAVVLDAYRRWLGTFVLGVPGGIPWLSIALVVGAGAGALGHRWWRMGAQWAGLAVAALLVLEPAVRLGAAIGIVPGPRYGIVAPNLAMWAVEAIVGIIATLAILHSRRSQVAA